MWLATVHRIIQHGMVADSSFGENRVPAFAKILQYLVSCLGTTFRRSYEHADEERS